MNLTKSEKDFLKKDLKTRLEMDKLFGGHTDLMAITYATSFSKGHFEEVYKKAYEEYEKRRKEEIKLIKSILKKIK